MYVKINTNQKFILEFEENIKQWFNFTYNSIILTPSITSTCTKNYKCLQLNSMYAHNFGKNKLENCKMEEI